MNKKIKHMEPFDFVINPGFWEGFGHGFRLFS